MLKLDSTFDYLSSISYVILNNKYVLSLYAATFLFSVKTGAGTPGGFMGASSVFGSFSSLFLMACVLVASQSYLLTRGRVADFAALRDGRRIVRVTLRLLLISLIALAVAIALQFIVGLVEFTAREPSGPVYYSGERPKTVRSTGLLTPLLFMLISAAVGLIWGVRIPHAVDKGNSERLVSGFQTVKRQRGRILKHVLKGYLMVSLTFGVVVAIFAMIVFGLSGGNANVVEITLGLSVVAGMVVGSALYTLVLADVYLHDRAENPQLYVSDGPPDATTPPGS